MKEKSKMLGVKICIPVVLVGLTFGLNYFSKTYASSSGDNPVVVSETAMEDEKIDDKPLKIVQKWESKNIKGLSEILGVTSENKILAGIGLDKNEFLQKYKEKNFQKMTDKEIDDTNKDLSGKVYRVNLKTLERMPLKNSEKDILTRTVGAGISPNGKKLDYEDGDKQCLYGLVSGKTINYAKGMIGNWSQDGEYLIEGRDVFHSNISESEEKKCRNKLFLYNVKKGTTKEVIVNPEVVNIVSYDSFYSKDGKNVYFIGEQQKEEKGDLRRQGIFKVNVQSEKIEPIMLLPYVDRTKKNFKENCMPSSDYRFIDEGKKIILNATINDEDGIYTYDIANKKFFRVVSTVKTKEGGYCASFWLSPDGSKIVYMNKTEENANNTKWNLYVAKVNGHRLTNRITLNKNIEIGGSLDKSVQWSSDSKKIIFFTTNGGIQSKGFYLSDENHINMVTFK
ncbi:hypothetical protein ACFIJ5_12850 [Haloimpatiens sp. FM7330]|uniref:TolB family protein n=1 Tax=Haloimpatiens sp. FM7330 TaxID=3298610 RepID=UPI00364005AD